MKIGLSSMMRERWIAVSRCAGSGNCARTGMIHGARTQRSAENAISAMKIAFRTLECDAPGFVLALLGEVRR